MILLALAMQTAVQAGSAPAPERFSILAPDCPVSTDREIVVCSRGQQGQRLPLPDDRGPPDDPVPSNPYRSGIGALAAEGTPCAATQWGCTVGFGPPVMPIVAAAAKAVKHAFARKPDKRGRIAIVLDDPPPPLPQR